MNDKDNKRVYTLMVILLKALILVLLVLCIFFIAYPRACVNIIEGRQTEDNSAQDLTKPLIPVNSDTKAAQQLQQQQAQQPVQQLPQPIIPPQTQPATQPVTQPQPEVTVTAPAPTKTQPAVTVTAPKTQPKPPATVTPVVTITPVVTTTPIVTVTTTTTQTVQSTQTAANAANNVVNTVQQQTTADLQAAQDAYDYNVVKTYVAAQKAYADANPGANTNDVTKGITQQVMNQYQLSDQDWQEIMLKANQKGWFNQLQK